jgi:hypothetical protein
VIVTYHVLGYWCGSGGGIATPRARLEIFKTEVCKLYEILKIINGTIPENLYMVRIKYQFSAANQIAASGPKIFPAPKPKFCQTPKTPYRLVVNYK